MLFKRRKRLQIGIIIFEVTDACNQACKFCYNYFKAPALQTTIAAPDYKLANRTLKKLLHQADVGSISFSGGEPMLVPKIHDLVFRARLGGSSVNILTNGTLLTDDDIAIFNDLGVAAIQIPLLSDDAAIHDAITQRPGSWAKAWANARRVVGVREKWLTPVLIISRMNVDSIESTMAMYGLLGVKRVMVNRFNIGGLGIRYAEDLVLSNDMLRDAFRRVDKQAEKLGIKVYSGVCTPMCVLDPREYPNIIFSHCTTDLVSRPLTISYRGDVRFCNHSPKVLGNIHNESLEEIIGNSVSEEYYSAIPEQCAGCALWERCKGGCRAASEQLFGRFDMADPLIR